MMIEYPDPDQRKEKLAKLIGIENRTWVQVSGLERVWAIADEDLERETEQKTSSVHFLRFELTAEMAGALRSGAALSVGCDHPEYRAELALPANVRDALVGDLA